MSGKDELAAGNRPAATDSAGSPGKGGRRGAVKGYRAKPERKAGSRAVPAARTLRLPDGKTLVLQKPPHDRNGPRPGKRPPRYWRSLAPLLSPENPVPERRINGWLLVLEAKKIPHLFLGGVRPFLYVPPLFEGVALHEIRAFEAERPVPIFMPPVRNNVAGVLLFLALFVVWHGLRWHWFAFHLPSPPFPTAAGDWAGLFGLDVYRARVLHEWWRAVTALTLHADETHLFGNMIFGLFFFIPLCRRAGLGLGIALALAAGILGNAGNALTREAHVISLGFSTALFGAVGSLCALVSADVVGHYLRFAHMHTAGQSNGSSGGKGEMLFALVRRLAPPLAAGLALLGLLGGGGEIRTDYAAHIWGFFCGVGCAVAALPAERALFRLAPARQAVVQALLFAASLEVLAGAWCYALLR